MTIRHYFAELISSDRGKASYRFTPDSTTKLYWGLVEFDLETFAARIVEAAPDPECWGWPQPAVCLRLGHKLQQQFAAGGTEPSKILE